MDFWKSMSDRFMKDLFVPYLKNWKEQKEKKGYIPTVELLIEELTNEE